MATENPTRFIPFISNDKAGFPSDFRSAIVADVDLISCKIVENFSTFDLVQAPWGDRFAVAK